MGNQIGRTVLPGGRLRHRAIRERVTFALVRLAYVVNINTRITEYWEVLKILGPPPGRSPFILHHCHGWSGHRVYEFKDRSSVTHAFKSLRKPDVKLKKLRGFKRLIDLGWKRAPYFYKPTCGLKKENLSPVATKRSRKKKKT